MNEKAVALNELQEKDRASKVSPEECPRPFDRAQVWEDDSAATECKACKKSFNVSRRYVYVNITCAVHDVLMQEAPLPQLRRDLLP
jgi:hypothetical protein